MRRIVGSALMGILCLIFSVSSTRAQDVAMPVGIIPVGDSPFALAISEDGTQATVVNLFPELSDATNIKLIDLGSQTVTRKLRVGTRLVAVTITGSRTLVVNEDQDFVIVVDLNSGAELARIGVGSRPSNITVASADTAVATNGTSGDLTFIDLISYRVKGDPVAVGSDPRDVAIHPNGLYAYVVLGGDNSVATVDLQFLTLESTVSVGKDPVAIAVTLMGVGPWLQT